MDEPVEAGTERVRHHLPGPTRPGREQPVTPEAAHRLSDSPPPTVSAEDAFREYYRTNSLILTRFVTRRIADPQTVRDICQECFEVAWRQFDPADPPALTWLFGVAWNRVRSTHRLRRRETRAVLQLVAQRPSDEPSDVNDTLAELLLTLDDKQRLVLELTYWDGLSAAEIAVLLQVSEGTVWQRLSRARAALRMLLADQSTKDETQ